MTENKQNKYVLLFNEIRATDLPLVGGKGANLGEMTHAGLPVPGGFCLTTRAYDRFLESSGKADHVFTLLENVRADDVETVRANGEKVREVLLDFPIPPEIVEEVRRVLEEFGADASYAVRSSATAEDLPDASFAGQQDTYLNISGEEDLLDAVRRCWVSLFTDRAIMYRIMNNFSHREVKLSVVVQRMVMSERSGIMFTADPLTGHRHTLAIDASFGLGEALVSGVVSPDTYRVDKRTMEIIDRHIGEKAVMIVPSSDGGTVTKSLEHSDAVVLSDEEILQLTQMGSQVEKYYSYPQDIEWAIEKGVLYLLQTRPITSLYPIEGLQREDGRFAIYFSSAHQQNMLNPMTPLSRSSLRILLPLGKSKERLENEYVRPAGGRLYIDITYPLRHRILRRVAMTATSQFDVLAPDAIQQLMQRPEFKRVKKKRVPLRFYLFGMKNMRRVMWAMWFKNLDGFVERTNSICDEFIEELTDRIGSAKLGKKRIVVILESMSTIFPIFLEWIPEAAAGIAATRMLSKWSSRWLSADDVEKLTLGVEGNVVNDMNLEIGDLADIARGYPELTEAFSDLGEDANAWLEHAKNLPGGDEFIREWDRFISRYGARGLSEIDIASPRWYEDPLPILRVIAEFLKKESGSHREHFAKMVQEREVVFEKLIKAGGRGIRGRFRAKRYRRLYYTMTRVGGMREHHKFLAVRTLAVIKENLKETSQELMRLGKLDRKDDIWYLTWEELLVIWNDDSTNWSQLIAKRKAEHQRFYELNPPLIITSDGETPVVQYKIDDAPEGALLGNPVSPGVVEGIAHVIHDPTTETIEPGEIMVAEFTDPGWTPLFINAGGLVLEIGGSLSHGAVVAREYGMPAVVGVREATVKLKTGQKIRVDGNRGIIEINI